MYLLVITSGYKNKYIYNLGLKIMDLLNIMVISVRKLFPPRLLSLLRFMNDQVLVTPRGKL